MVLTTKEIHAPILTIFAWTFTFVGIKTTVQIYMGLQLMIDIIVANIDKTGVTKHITDFEPSHVKSPSKQKSTKNTEPSLAKSKLHYKLLSYFVIPLSTSIFSFLL